MPSHASVTTEEQAASCSEAELPDGDRRLPSPGPRALPTTPSSHDERDSLLQELRRLQGEQEAAERELQALNLQRDQETERAELAEVAVRAGRDSVEELQRRLHGLQLRLQMVAEEEASWRELVKVLGSQESEEAARRDRDRSERRHSLADLRAELEARRRELRERDAEAERQRRLAIDEQCMELQALLDYVTGRISVSQEALEQLLGGVDGGAGHRSRSNGQLEEAQRLLEREQQRQREEMRALVALCNEELRRRSRSVLDFLDDEGLPQLLNALLKEGLVETRAPDVLLKPDSGRSARLRKVVNRP